MSEYTRVYMSMFRADIMSYSVEFFQLSFLYNWNKSQVDQGKIIKNTEYSAGI